uniref:Uncharacterized protein n=1 Tax=Panagrolaimus sp. PS1159 TaxID=55785 RepID=A0AC35F806_9BILA
MKFYGPEAGNWNVSSITDMLSLLIHLDKQIGHALDQSILQNSIKLWSLLKMATNNSLFSFVFILFIICYK